MENYDFSAELRDAFAVEAGEHLQAMTKWLLEIEKAPDPARRRGIVESIFREAHSLKGASRAVTRPDVESVCQALESVFASWKETPAAIPPEAFDTVNAALDFVGQQLTGSGAPNSSAEVNAQREMVRQVMQLAGPTSPVPCARTPVGAAALSRTQEPNTSLKGLAGQVSQLATSEREKAAIAETVRVPIAKMDSLLLQAEEMLALKLTASQHVSDLRELRSALHGWGKEWAKARIATRDASGPVRDFLEWNGSQIEALEKRLGLLAGAAERDERTARTMVDDLLGDAKRIVMLPASWLLDFLPKQVRDLSREVGKEVELVVQGSEVEIDKRILEEMKAPLTHLVRNAIDHGLEKPHSRLAQGKPSSGTLAISVSQLDDNKVEIKVSDDGEGIDLAQVKASAVKNGVISETAAGELSDAAAIPLIFLSGISTSPILTEISGHGLGMAIVREKVDKLGGEITIESKPGLGASFRMVLPLTLATFKGILVSAGGQTFAIPTMNVLRTARVMGAAIRTVENRETIVVDDRPVAFVRLSDVLELPRRDMESPDAYTEILILSAAGQRAAFGVESVINEREVLVKKLSKPLLRVRNINGATVLGSGAPVLILNVTDLLKSAARLASGGMLRPVQRAAEEGKKTVRRILVADDSVTSRMLLKNILESGGYKVTTAIDGMEAFTTLRAGEFDLVVSDVEMPRMDGFEFTARIRTEKRFSDLPVVLVTALASREHRERGIDVGASAYIVKSDFDQSNLLEVVGKLV
jgi:two-component system, chemotaxis family, sensor kinase CheA